MDRKLWVMPQAGTAKTNQLAGAALEAGCDGVLVAADAVDEAASVGRLTVGTVDGETLSIGELTGRLVPIKTPDDQANAKALIGKVDVLVVAPEDWTIIPLENLVAWVQGTETQLFARVRSVDDARVALTTLETGVHGLVLETDDAATVKAVAREVKSSDAGQLALVTGTVTAIEDAGMGDRVCVDTTSLLQPDEGLLVGSASSLMVLVASEASEAGYVASRPFRVNAGAVHAYVQGPDGRTQYLSEVGAGTRLVVVGRDGASRVVTTGRAKVERRPMLLVKVRVGDAAGSGRPRDGSLVVQNAETIRLVTADGVKSVSELAVGDEVLAYAGHAGGRHFGTAIDETIEER